MPAGISYKTRTPELPPRLRPATRRQSAHRARARKVRKLGSGGLGTAQNLQDGSWNSGNVTVSIWSALADPSPRTIVGCAPLCAARALAQTERRRDEPSQRLLRSHAPVLCGGQQSLCDPPWLAEHGQNVPIYQSHGASGAQARAVTRTSPGL